MSFLKKSIYSVIFLIIVGILGLFFYKKISKAPLFKLSKIQEVKNLVHVAIIGSGPAGLSAALYGARGKLHTVVFQGPKPGGQLTETSWVENWPGMSKTLGIDLIKGLQEQAQEFGAVITAQTIVKVDFEQWPFTLWTDEENEIKALTVIIATGANPKKLNCPGETEFWGKGVTTCAICDAPFYKDSDVVVVGGGDSAAEEAMQLASYAKTIRILVRSDKMRSAPQMQERLKEYKNIQIIYNTAITAIKGDEKHVHAIEITTNGKQETWPIDGVFLAIGHSPNTNLFENQKIKLTQQKYIVLHGSTQETSMEGVFAAGDVADFRYRQAGVAAGDGIKAALDAAELLRTVGLNDELMHQTSDLLYNPQADKERLELPLIMSDQEFKEAVLQAPVPVVIDFYTQYCPSCLQMFPAVESAAYDLKDQVKFVKVDALAFRDLAVKLEVPTVPTLLIFKNGKEIARTKTVMQKKELIEFVQKYL